MNVNRLRSGVDRCPVAVRGCGHNGAERCMTNSREVARYPRVPGRPRSRLTGINPRHFSKPAWYRFSRDRRARYVSRISGEFTDVQAALVENMIWLEWAALQVEVEGGLVGLREGREHRRLFQRLLADFEATLRPPPAPRVVQQRRRAPRLVDIVSGAEGADRV